MNDETPTPLLFFLYKEVRKCMSPLEIAFWERRKSAQNLENKGVMQSDQ